MGNLASILATRAHSDQPSISEPGQLSVVTDLVTKDMVPDVEEFFDELMQHIMDPLLPWEPYFLKELRKEKHDDDPTKTTLKVILDCDKIRGIFPQFAQKEFIRHWLAVTARPDTLSVQTEEFSTDGSVMRAKVCSQLHREGDGFRVEVWMYDQDGKRSAGQVLAGIADLFFLKPLLLCRLNQKVRVRSNVEMATSGGKSVLSEALDEYYTQEEVFDVIIRLIKQECVDWKGTIHYNSDDDFECRYETEIPLDQFGAAPPAAPAAPAGEEAGTSPEGTEEAAKPPEDEPEDVRLTREAMEKAAKDWEKAAKDVASRVTVTENQMFILRTCRRASLDRKGFQLVVAERIMDELFSQRFIIIHNNPVRIEQWSVLPNGERFAGFKEAVAVRLLMMKLCADADAEKQVKEMDESQSNFYF